MATHVGEVLGGPESTSRQPTVTQMIDRWIYVIMAVWFILTALVGFVPTSIGKIMQVQEGIRPPFPLILHMHAVLMGSWLLLLLAQSWLMATGRRTFHMQLGLAGAVLAPAIVVVGAILIPTMFHLNLAMIQAAPPGALRWGTENTTNFISSLVAAQIMTGILFTIFVSWAFLVRRKDPGMHKRLMILATALPLPAAIDRIAWLPSTYPESPVLTPLLYAVVWVLPMFIWDLFRLKQVHRAYWAWLALYVPSAAVVYMLWWSPGWIGIVHRMMGIA